MYLFSYFKKDEESLFLAKSKDGYSWEELNDGKVVFSSSVGSKAMRDPFIYLDDHGIYHLVWTDGWSSKSIGYACSNDLINWQDEKLLPVMEHIPETQNTWAPEIFYDSSVNSYRIIWSSTVGTGGRDHRIWSVTTRNFKDISTAKVFFDPGYNVIDANVTDLGHEYFMLFKDERGENKKQTSNKAIRSCYITKENNDQPPVHSISDLLTPELTEGPTLFAVDRKKKKEWIMLVDNFTNDKYSAFFSRDLLKWEDISNDLNLPYGARHGSVIRIKDI